MHDTPLHEHIHNIISAANHIVVIQADNPDADSLGTALALEHILGDLGKQVTLQCSVDMPSYLRYLSGWDRVTKELPNQFDAAMIVDASVVPLLSALQNAPYRKSLHAHPLIVLDHHETTNDVIDFADVTMNDPSVSSTGELVFELATKLKWQVSLDAAVNITAAILGDTQGLTNDLTRATTYRIMADLVELGVNRSALEEARREYSKMPEAIFRYKAELIKRTELHYDGVIATLTIPQPEINTYSPLYNPSALIQFDTLQTIGVWISIVFKTYDTGRITAAIRSNSDAPVAGMLAEHFGGGGHAHASGFKIEDGRPLNEVKSECIQVAHDLISNQATGSI